MAEGLQRNSAPKRKLPQGIEKFLSLDSKPFIDICTEVEILDSNEIEIALELKFKIPLMQYFLFTHFLLNASLAAHQPQKIVKIELSMFGQQHCK